MAKLWSRRASLIGLAGGLAAAATAHAAPAPHPGLVVLTVGGLIDAPNRPAFDARRDRFFDHHNLSFGKARCFTLADLTGLPQQAVSTSAEGGEARYLGPLMQDVLSASQPTGGANVARLYALDGYAAELALTDITAQRWILAMEADGKPFGIGDFGPLYAMRQLPPGQTRSEEEGAKWVFSIYYIEIAA